jgi:hypothetical protein
MGLEQVVDYLTQAPKIVRESHPMTWTYFSNPPPDGSSFLLWQPQSRHLRMSSDGYFWVDNETQYTQDVKGYVSIDLRTRCYI